MDFLKDLSLDKVRNLAEDAFNQAKPKTDLEAKVYEVLSHKNWGSSSTLMNEVARDTFDYDKFAVISQLMWEAMENQRPAAWRVVFKGLTLLEHLIKNGSERCVDDARNHGHSLRALHQFNYYEGTIDRGLGVREKSKQIVEILADDDRIREERQRARKLREKFGGSLGGSGIGGGGGGGGQYAGYGNDNWDQGATSGTGGGYGDGGIGSKAGGRYDDDGGSAAASGYGGRYDNDTSTTAAAAPTPTFAAIPDETPKKSKGKKKKGTNAAASAEPVVDLFSFDDPTPASAAAAAGDDDFDNFQSAGGAAPAFADPFAAPVQQPFAAPVQQMQFDAFGGAANLSQPQFDAFVGAPAQPAMASNMFPSNNIMGGGSGMMQQQQQPKGGSTMGFAIGGGMNGSQPQQHQAQNDDDDFGDFADAAPSRNVSSGPPSSNPLSKLISLDGLSKNTNKLEDKLNQPIIANAAAATFIQEKEQIQATVKQSAKGSNMSFAGIDGLHKSSMMGGMSMGGQMNTMMSPAMSMGVNPSVMGSGGASASLIGMLDPNEMMKNKTQTQTVPQQGVMNPQMHGTMNSQMQGMVNPQMQGMMSPQMHGMMSPQMQGMMTNPQTMGMTNPQMQGVTNPQMMGMMNAQMMGGAGMGMMNPNMPQQGFGGMQGGGTMNQQQMMMNQHQMMMNPGFGGMQSGVQGNQGMTGMHGNPAMGTQGQVSNGFSGMQQGMGQQNSSMDGGPMGGQPMGSFR